MTQTKVNSRCLIDKRLSHIQQRTQPKLASDNDGSGDFETLISDNAIERKNVQEQATQDNDSEYHEST